MMVRARMGCCAMILLLLLGSAAAISPAPQPTDGGSIVTYWGQASTEGNLSSACLTGNYGIVIISFLVVFGRGMDPQINLANHCNPSYGGCEWVSNDIEACQDLGVKVFLSVGGAAGFYELVSKDDALSVATYLYDNYLGGTSSSRPLGPAVLDGIDLDLEQGSSDYYADMAQYLVNFAKGDSRKLHLSAAPQCPFPDAYDGPGGNTALQTGLFDYVWVQFYNNPPCQYNCETKNVSGILAAWNSWTTALPTSKIFLGLPGSPSASTGTYSLDKGFIPSDVLISEVLPVIRQKCSNYGGVMIWSYFYDQNPCYSAAIASAV